MVKDFIFFVGFQMIDRRVNERRIFALMVCFIFLFVGWFSTAKADQWTVLGGFSKFQVHDDGVWYQEAFPYNFKLTPPSVGLRYDSDGWTVGYMNLGKVTSYAKAVALDGRYPGDGGYNSATKSCNGECWPLSTWYGKGDVQGIFFGLTKPVTPEVTIEGGVYIYRPTWQMHVPDWRECRDCAPKSITVTHKAKLEPGPYFGIRYQEKDNPLSLNLSFWHTMTRGDEWCSLYTRITTNLSVGYSF